jgi:dihydroneopterin aldolase
MTHALAQDTIIIEELDIECIIGIYEHERSATQRVIVEAELSIDTTAAALTDCLEHTVDYEWVTHQIAFVLKAGKFKLLETAAHAICQTLLLAPLEGESRCAIEAVGVKLRKPGALGGKGLPTLQVKRQACATSYRRETKSFGTVDVILETREVGLYRLNIAPRNGIALHVHRKMEEAEFVLSDGLLCQGEVAKRCDVRVWPRGLAHRYDNPTDAAKSLLCVDRPPFEESDETPVEGVPGDLEATDAWSL